MDKHLSKVKTVYFFRVFVLVDLTLTSSLREVVLRFCVDE